MGRHPLEGNRDGAPGSTSLRVVTAMDNPQNTLSLAYLEQLYLDYVRDSSSVPEEWRQHFAALGTNGAAERSGPTFQAFSIFNPPSGGNGAVPRDQLHLARLQERVDLLIRNYRVRGHIIAKIDPLGRVNPRPPELEPEYYGFTPEDLDAVGFYDDHSRFQSPANPRDHSALRGNVLRGDRCSIHAHR